MTDPARILPTLRQHVATWSGVRQVLATLAVDPARQGQRIIKSQPCWVWECGYCGLDTPEDGAAPPCCMYCGHRSLRRFPSSSYYLQEGGRGGRGVSRYTAADWRIDWVRWAEAACGHEAAYIVQTWAALFDASAGSFGAVARHLGIRKRKLAWAVGTVRDAYMGRTTR